MKRSFVSLALALLASAVFAQTSPRGPVIPSSGRGGDGIPGPDPTGVYSGTVTFTLEGEALTQTWRIALKTHTCPTCPAGQYVLTETNYSLVRFPTGIERGSVWGILDRDGTLSLELRGINCSYLSLGLGGGSLYQGGALGPVPGPALRLIDGTISGRVSGYDCFGRKIFADVVLRKEGNEDPASCLYYGGVYDGEFETDCGAVVHAEAIVSQSGCVITVYSPAARAAFSVDLATRGEGTVAVNFTDGCSGSGRGDVTITGGVLSGIYDGTSNGGAGCCAPGPVAGTFSLVPK